MPLSPGQVLNNRYRIASLLCLLTILSVFPAACDGSTQNPAQVTVSEVEMALIPAGEFQMGSEYGESDEQPVHTVYLDAYSIDVYEVIYQQYAQFLQSQVNQQEGGVAWLEADSSSVHVHQVGGKWQADAGFEMHPVVEVSWYGARAYCQWRGGDLPTEAQWEWAARAGSGTRYWFGSDASEFGRLANLADASMKGFRTGYDNLGKSFSFTHLPYVERVNDGNMITAPVGQYRPNPWGLYDVHGNVSEWTLSNFQPYPYDEQAARGLKVARGGSWKDQPEHATLAFRFAYEKHQSVWDVGLRVVMAASVKTVRR